MNDELKPLELYVKLYEILGDSITEDERRMIRYLIHCKLDHLRHLYKIYA